MNADSLQNILKTLSQTRPVFHSEADFQFSLATAIKSAYPTAEIRLERPFPHFQGADHTIYLDILVILDQKFYPIELKYKTAALTPDPCVINGESYQLKKHGAYHSNQHHLLKDLERLEYLSEQPNFATGFAIWLTNDPAYWQTLFHDRASHAHAISWQNYSQNLTTDSGEPITKGNFRYALIEVTNKI